MTFTPDRQLNPPNTYWVDVETPKVEIQSEWWDNFNWDLYSKYLENI